MRRTVKYRLLQGKAAAPRSFHKLHKIRPVKDPSMNKSRPIGSTLVRGAFSSKWLVRERVSPLEYSC